MKTVCFAAQSLARSAWAMSGVQPLTSPPLTLATFDPQVMAGADVVFFKLHGLEGQPFWYGDNGITACSAEQIAGSPLKGAFVFIANCFGGNGSPMVQATFDAGAECVITGTGPNIAGITQAAGADDLGRCWRGALGLGRDAAGAFRVARMIATGKNLRLKDDINSFALLGNQKAKLGRRV